MSSGNLKKRIPKKATLDELGKELAKANAEGASKETVQDILDKIVELTQELAAQEVERQREADLKEKIASEARYKPTRAKLFVRRSKDVDIDNVVPVVDVFDDIELSDIKKAKTGHVRIYTSDDELEAFQELKAEDVENIDYGMVEDRVKAKKMGNSATVVDPETVDIGGEEKKENVC